ncbi:hypothetical protein DVH24_042368 [Malus domestica]|uniref:Uncharacterized protein n=1 Tax=Malus domestica TaxID=3750 RepID=A0A498J168_MALDO|nr:hypothetical protein DVH24_042368 [Malus domestica]
MVATEAQIEIAVAPCLHHHRHPATCDVQRRFHQNTVANRLPTTSCSLLGVYRSFRHLSFSFQRCNGVETVALHV